MVQMLEFLELPLPLVQLPLLSSKTKENPDNKRSKDVPRKSRNQSEVMPDSIARVIVSHWLKLPILLISTKITLNLKQVSKVYPTRTKHYLKFSKQTSGLFPQNA